MPLSPTWKTHFLTGLGLLNRLSSRNIIKCTEVMEIQANVDTKMKYLTNDQNLILFTNKNKQVTVLQNLKNYGGSFFNPVDKVAALIGMGHKAAVIKLDTGTATTSLCVCMLNFVDIFTCQTTIALRAFPTPNENGLINFKGLRKFIPTLFL